MFLSSKFLESQSTALFLDDQLFHYTRIPLFSAKILASREIKAKTIAHATPSIIQKTATKYLIETCKVILPG